MKQWPDFNPREYLDPITMSSLQRVKEKKLDKDFDYVLLIVQKNIGNRLGKSQLGLLAASFIDNDFNFNKLLFLEDDYWRAKPKLTDKSSLLFDEAVNVFWSRESGQREKKAIFREFLVNPSRNFFTVIIIPSLALLQKDFRNIKINCIWVVDKRGRFKCYSRNTGRMEKIKIDPTTKKVSYPAADFTGNWKNISKTDFWKDYIVKKKKYILKVNPLNVHVVKATDKVERMLEDSYTVQDMAKICHVSDDTARTWIKKFNVFKKSDILMDFKGRTRIKRSGFDAGMKRLDKLKRKNIKRRGRKR